MAWLGRDIVHARSGGGSGASDGFLSRFDATGQQIAEISFGTGSRAHSVIVVDGSPVATHTTRGQNLRQEPLGGMGMPEDRPAPGNRKACPFEVYLDGQGTSIARFGPDLTRIATPSGDIRMAGTSIHSIVAYPGGVTIVRVSPDGSRTEAAPLVCP